MLRNPCALRHEWHLCRSRICPTSRTVKTGVNGGLKLVSL
jgi:hypothetical protein